MTPMKPAARSLAPRQRARSRALDVASELFYRSGVRAIGMEQIVTTSGIAKTTIYRHFPTKDALVAAFLEREDRLFWAQWESEIANQPSPAAQLQALCAWIGDRVQRAGYRGCPQINVAAEFADPAHPATGVAKQHKSEMHRKLAEICAQAGLAEPEIVAMQIALLFDGAFTSAGRLDHIDAGNLLWRAVLALLKQHRPEPAQ